MSLKVSGIESVIARALDILTSDGAQLKMERERERERENAHTQIFILKKKF